MSYQFLRTEFLEYFKQKDHKIMPSSSLIPADDPSILFTNAGMNQFKDWFLGTTPALAPATATAQRCVRAGGKHNDLENVGYTARHHTFFEMLGNFSFGSYFKTGAIEYAWSFIRNNLSIPQDKLWITVHHQDQESFKIWRDHIGVDEKRIVFCSDKDNFWAMGDRGPCGPCTEIFYDHGPSVAGGPPGSPDADGDRYMEIWNLVFMQYDRQADGSYLPLPKPCVDTGMGLERLACVYEGVFSNFDTSLFRLLKTSFADQIGCPITEVKLNVLADHCRASVFLIADGATPSAEGRGYVLRRLIRRALSHGYQLGLRRPFLHQHVKVVVRLMQDAYPYLKEKIEHCEKVIAIEEQQFFFTLQSGFKYANNVLQRSKECISGNDLFQLYDTYGFPIDIAIDLAKENHIEVDRAGFDLRMEQQKVQSRNKADAKTWTVSELPQADQVFHRDRTASRTQVLAVYPDDAHHDRSWLCLSETVFYAESGGQVGDTGWIELEDGQKVPVYDTQKAHHLSMVQVGFGPAFWADHQNVTALLDSNRRANISIHHTATHLLHAAIHHVLGHSASQKGSRVESDRLRFDFAYDKPLTQEQKNAIEAFCREHIQMNHAVVTDLLSKEDAIARGALAFFGDKYGETVRMLSIGADVSKELCGGTHAPELNDLVAVLICSDEAVSAGVRRIQAVAGQSALDFLLASRSRCAAISSAMRVSDDLIVQTVQQLQTQLSTTQKSLIALRERAFVARLQSVQPIHRHDGTQCYVVEASTDEVQFFNQGNDLLSERHRLNNAPHTISIIWNQDEQGKITMQLCEFGAHSEKTHELNTLVDHLKVEYGFKGGGKVGRVQLGLQGQHDHAWSHILKSILKIT